MRDQLRLATILSILVAISLSCAKPQTRDARSDTKQATSDAEAESPLPPVNPHHVDSDEITLEECSDEQDAEEGITYDQDIRPILEANCTGCHSSSISSGALPLNSYQLDSDDNQGAWEIALARVFDGSMPPSGALSEDQQATLGEWLDAGIPKTDRLSKCSQPIEPLASDLIPASCDESEAAPSLQRIWRLTHSQYNNATRDLLKINHNLADSFVTDGRLYGFSNGAENLSVGNVLAEQYHEAAKQLSLDVFSIRGKEVADCENRPGDCGEQFIRSFGEQAYGRELTETEVTRLLSIRDIGKPRGVGIKLMIQAILESPFFLYRSEIGSANSMADTVDLEPHEIASQMSFLIWNSLPDAELIQKAKEGALTDPLIRLEQFKRMLKDPRAESMFGEFFQNYLEIAELESQEKTLADGTTVDGSKMTAETRHFVDYISRQKGGSLKELLTANYSFIDQELGQLYGIEVDSKALVKTELNANERKGLLTHPSILAATSKNQTNPFIRGAFLREKILCQTLPSPPNVDPIDEESIDPNLSVRDAFAQHSSNPSCAGCHNLIDPLGFSFESFDGVGTFRTMHRGHKIDGSGVLSGSNNADGAFDNHLGLIDRLAESSQVADCMVLQVFRYAEGRNEDRQDMCRLSSIKNEFEASGGRLTDIIAGFITSENFTKRGRRD